MHPLMFVVMLFGGHSLMAPHARPSAKVPTAVIDVRYEICPVKGGNPRPEIAVLRRNRVYHFCSQACLEVFTKNPRSELRKIKNPNEVALRTINPDGIDPVSGHRVHSRRNPPFLVRGNTITFYATKDTVGKDENSSLGDKPLRSDHSSHKSEKSASDSNPDAHAGHSMGCH